MYSGQSWCKLFNDSFFLNVNMICVRYEEVLTRMIREIQTLEHGVTGVKTSGDIARSRYTETCYRWSIQIIKTCGELNSCDLSVFRF